MKTEIESPEQLRTEINQLIQEKEELIQAIKPIAITHRARSDHPLDGPYRCDVCKVWRKMGAK